MKKLALLLSFILFISCATVKPPEVYLPKFEPLPEVQWSMHDGEACTTDTTQLLQREKLRDVREQTLTDMLKALGAKEAP